jgi:5-formyltetrahydrofolate cyclo-ligase
MAVPHDPIQLDKRALRKSWLADRRALDITTWQQLSQAISQQLQDLPQYQQAQTILAYSSCHQEPDLSALMQDKRKIWGLPRCVGQALVWHRFNPAHDQLRSGHYGILEPAADWPQLDAQQVDLMLVPCVGADRRGYRLGYGGGFYDQLLQDPKWAAVPTIGICFAAMLVDRLPHDPWDQPLQGICTEIGAIEPTIT